MPKPSSKKVEKTVEELTYEEALAELEAPVRMSSPLRKYPNEFGGAV
jgi:hypothetical protein